MNKFIIYQIIKYNYLITNYCLFILTYSPQAFDTIVDRTTYLTSNIIYLSVYLSSHIFLIVHIRFTHFIIFLLFICYILRFVVFPPRPLTRM